MNLGLFLNLFELQSHALSKMYIKRLLHYLLGGLNQICVSVTNDFSLLGTVQVVMLKVQHPGKQH